MLLYFCQNLLLEICLKIVLTLVNKIVRGNSQVQEFDVLQLRAFSILNDEETRIFLLWKQNQQLYYLAIVVRSVGHKGRPIAGRSV